MWTDDINDDYMKTSLQEIQDCFRELTPQELERTKSAMKYLYKKGISIDKIRRLMIWQVKDDGIKFVYETKHFRFVRVVPYKNTCLETQIKAVCCVGKCKKVFPKAMWLKRSPSTVLVPSFSETEVKELLGFRVRKERKLIVSRKEKEKIMVNLNF